MQNLDILDIFHSLSQYQNRVEKPYLAQTCNIVEIMIFTQKWSKTMKKKDSDIPKKTILS